MRYYFTYLEKRLTNNSSYSSEIEKNIISAIDTYNIQGYFTFIFFDSLECYECMCYVDEQKRFYVESLKCVEHQLAYIYNDNCFSEKKAEQFDRAYSIENNSFVYDSHYVTQYPELSKYNEMLGNSLSNLDFKNNNEDVYISGCYTKWKAFNYTLQKKTGNITVVRPNHNVKQNSRIRFSNKLLSQVIHLSQSRISIRDVISKKGVEVYVPMDDQSLSSIFIGDISWSDIIPSKCLHCFIGNTKCLYIKLFFEVDCFNNLFCKVDDTTGHKKTSLIYTPFGKDKNPKTRQSDVITDDNCTLQDSTLKDNTVINKTAMLDFDSVSSCNKVEANQSFDGLQPQDIDIEEGDIYTYYDLFGAYLKNGTVMEIWDPFIYLGYQFKNLEQLIATSITVSKETQTARLEKVHLVTRPPSKAYKLKGKFIEIEDAKQKQINDLDNLKRQLEADVKIQFTYEFRDFHDRCIILNNGWRISIGRGLGIFKRAENRFTEPTCYKTDIHISRNEERATIERGRKAFK